jgi:HlyD family secretion protein
VSFLRTTPNKVFSRLLKAAELPASEAQAEETSGAPGLEIEGNEIMDVIRPDVRPEIRPTPRPAARRRARRRFGVLPLLGALALAGALGWWAWVRTHPANNWASNLITAPVTRGDLVETVSATGSVTAQTGAQVKIGSQITGRIKHLYADVGSHVKAGQVIAQLDLPDLQAQLDQAVANLAQARTKLIQQESGVTMQSTQTSSAIAQAQAQLQSARANLRDTQAGANLQIATAQQELAQAQATARNSAVNLKRQQALLQRGFVAQNVVDQAQADDAVNQSKVQAAQSNLQLVTDKVAADLQNARDQVTQAAAALKTAQANSVQNVLKQQDIEQAREAVRVAQAQVHYSKDQLDKTYIRTPISGTVLQLAAQQGETLAAGLSAPTLIIVADLERLQVDAFVDETDIGKVRLGQPTDVTVDAYPHHVFKGRVTKIAAGSTIQQGVVTYDVTIAIQDPKHLLRPDMTASTTIDTGTRSNVLLVPAEAVKLGARGSTVNVLAQKDGHPAVEPRRVRTGGSDGVNTEIRSGLQEGETVVLAGLNQAQGQQRRGGSSPFGPSGGRRGG